MPGAVRLGDVCNGGCGYLPRNNDTASTNVFINGIAAHRQGDHWPVHPDAPIHDGGAQEGSPNVFVNNLAKCRKGDKTACDATMLGCSSNVLIN